MTLPDSARYVVIIASPSERWIKPVGTPVPVFRTVAEETPLLSAVP